MKANRSTVRILITLSALAALSACSAPRVIPPAPAPAPAPRPVQPRPLLPPPADWRDAAQTPGNWLWSVSGGRSTAAFGLPGSAPVATLACDRAGGRVILSRSGTATAAVPMQIDTSAGNFPLLSEPARAAPGSIAVSLPPRSPVLDALAFSRGRFAVETAGQPTLYLPSWPELSRVIEDCR